MTRSNMQLSTLIFILFAAFSFSEASKSTENFIRSRAECQIEVQLSDISLAKAILKRPVDDPKVEECAICILKKIGSMSADGKLQIEDIRLAAKEAFGAKKADKVVEECAIEKSTVEKTALHLIECWIKNMSN